MPAAGAVDTADRFGSLAIHFALLCVSILAARTLPFAVSSQFP